MAEPFQNVRRDLVLLVPDRNIEYGLRGLLGRPHAIGTRSIDFQPYVHPRRDPACARDSANFLRPFIHEFRHALVVLDFDGSGRADVTSTELAEEVRADLAANGWDERAAVTVIDPEVEAWVFSPSPNVEACLGWPRNKGRVRRWLEMHALWTGSDPKPRQPREALERVLREIGRPRSSTIYECPGKRVSVRQCTDPSFVQMLATLSAWFPEH